MIFKSSKSKQKTIFFYQNISFNIKLMSISLLIVLLALISNLNADTAANSPPIVSGSWTVSNNTKCFGNLNINSLVFKVAVSNNITNQARLNYFLPNGTEIFGTCQATTGNVSLGLITTSFYCDTTSSLFKYVQNPIVIQWDSYDSLAITLNTTQSITNGNTTTTTFCQVTGSNLSIYYENNTWRVDSCTCYPCGYTVNSTFSIQRINDINNFPGINMSGQIEGPYCNNTMVPVDQCALNYTENTTDTYPYSVITNMKCYYAGNLQTTQLTFWNGTLTLNWGSCVMIAVPRTNAQTWGGKNAVFGMVWVILIIMFFGGA